MTPTLPTAPKTPRVVIGQRFGHLVVIAKEKPRHWKVRCDCGNIKIVQGSALAWAPRPTRSCGCMRRQWLGDAQRTHGCSIKNGSVEFSTFIIWQAMVWRCYNPKNTAYKWYGARGIKVCKRWRDSFANFVEDMGFRPGKLTLSRQNNNGDYSKRNCKWESMTAQANNTRANRRIRFQGVTMTVTQWARSLGINKGTLRDRLDSWSVMDALMLPLRPTRTKRYGT